MGIFSKLKREKNLTHHNKFDYIFYKIVDLDDHQKKYLLRCINTSATFYATLEEIVFDIDILYGLHPIQACYIGLEYARIAKKPIHDVKKDKKLYEKLNRYPTYRYGNYRLCYQDRESRVVFVDTRNDQEFMMTPEKIALSKEWIEEFDATQAFHIGLLAGFEMHKRKNAQRPHLRLVKNDT